MHQETIEEHAQRIERKIAFDKRRTEFQREQGIQAFNQQFAELKKSLGLRAKNVMHATSIRLDVCERQDGFWIYGLDRALGLTWRQKYFNNLDDVRLHCHIYSDLPPGPAQWMFEKPTVVLTIRFTFDLLPSEVGGWILHGGPSRAFTTEALADYLIKFYLDHGRKK